MQQRHPEVQDAAHGAPHATLTDMLRAHARRHPDRVALIQVEDGETETARLSWAGLDAAAGRVAAALADRDLAGERVLIACPSPRDFMVGFLGCLRAGAVAVPVPAGATGRLGERVRAIAADCAPRLILAGPDVRPGARPDGEADARAGIPWTTVAACETAPPGRTPASDPCPDPGAVAMLQYTSGSTRRPRGVALSQSNLLANLAMLRRAAGLGAETTVSWMPLHHDMGLIAMALQTLHGGGTCVLMSPLHFVQRPLRWLACIARYGATLSGAPTFAYRLCVERARAAPDLPALDLSAWRCAIAGAEPLRAEVLDAFADTFRPAGFRREALFPAYGLAEATVFATGGPAGDGARLRVDAEASSPGGIAEGARDGRILVACGALPATGSLRIVDPERRTPLPDGRVGEIWLRGPHVAKGYWSTPEDAVGTFDAALDGTEEVAAEEVAAAEVADGTKGGWLRTGDLGLVAGGRLYVTGRLKDLILVRGANHYPQDLEETVAASHPAFTPDGGAAFTVEADGEEQVVVVHEITRPAAKALVSNGLDARALLSAAVRDVAGRHGLALYDLVLLRPRGLPRTSSGKVQRRRCRADYLRGALPRACDVGWPGLARFRTDAAKDAVLAHD